MEDSYYAAFLRTKSLQNGKPPRRAPRKPSRPRKLSDMQLAAYRWLVDTSIIKLLDDPTPSTLADCVAASNFAALVKMARFFGVILPSARSGPSRISAVLGQLRERGMLGPTVDAERVAAGDRAEIGRLLIELHQAAGLAKQVGPPDATEAEVSDWLVSLGLLPATGDSWIGAGRVRALGDDRMRNGDLLRGLCIVFRPEIFEGALPPAKSPREMIQRVKQALAVLADEGAIQNLSEVSAEAIVKGVPGAVEPVLAGAMDLWQTRMGKMRAPLQRRLGLKEL
jgi:hypothetical protein